jgi:hypothetical protein
MRIATTESETDIERLLKQTTKQESKNHMICVSSSVFRMTDQNSQISVSAQSSQHSGSSHKLREQTQLTFKITYLITCIFPVGGGGGTDFSFHYHI